MTEPQTQTQELNNLVINVNEPDGTVSSSDNDNLNSNDLPQAPDSSEFVAEQQQAKLEANPDVFNLPRTVDENNTSIEPEVEQNSTDSAPNPPENNISSENDSSSELTLETTFSMLSEHIQSQNETNVITENIQHNPNLILPIPIPLPFTSDRLRPELPERTSILLDHGEGDSDSDSDEEESIYTELPTREDLTQMKKNQRQSIHSDFSTALQDLKELRKSRQQPDIRITGIMSHLGGHDSSLPRSLGENSSVRIKNRRGKSSLARSLATPQNVENTESPMSTIPSIDITQDLDDNSSSSTPIDLAESPNSRRKAPSRPNRKSSIFTVSQQKSIKKTPPLAPSGQPQTVEETQNEQDHDYTPTEQHHTDNNDNSDSSESITINETKDSFLENTPHLSGNMTIPESKSVTTIITPKIELSPEERRVLLKSKVAHEILSTEQTYVSALRLIVMHFMRNFQASQIVSTEVTTLLFSNVEHILKINETFLRALHPRISSWDDTPEKDQHLGDVFLELAPFLKIYSEYLRNFNTVLTTLPSLMKKSSFLQFLTRLESDPEVRLNLPGYLIQPIQRLPRYQMLVKELMKRTQPDHFDHKELSKALDLIVDINRGVNEAVRERENLEQILCVEASFVNKHPSIIQPGRKFIRDGLLVKMCRKGPKPRYFALFTDILIYAAPIATSTNKYRYSRTIDLSQCHVVSLEDNEVYQNAFQVINQTKSFTVFGENPTQKTAWLTDLMEVILSNKEKEDSLRKPTKDQLKLGLFRRPSVPESKTEVDLAPIWTPNQLFKKCQRCTSKFSIRKRRHHCRHCGFVICSDCSRNRHPLPYLDSGDRPVRVCDTCYQDLTGSISSKVKPKVRKLTSSQKNRNKQMTLTAMKAKEIHGISPVVVRSHGELPPDASIAASPPPNTTRKALSDSKSKSRSPTMSKFFTLRKSKTPKDQQSENVTVSTIPVEIVQKNDSAAPEDCDPSQKGAFEEQIVPIIIKAPEALRISLILRAEEEEVNKQMTTNKNGPTQGNEPSASDGNPSGKTPPPVPSKPRNNISTLKKGKAPPPIPIKRTSSTQNSKNLPKTKTKTKTPPLIPTTKSANKIQASDSKSSRDVSLSDFTKESTPEPTTNPNITPKKVTRTRIRKTRVRRTRTSRRRSRPTSKHRRVSSTKKSTPSEKDDNKLTKSTKTQNSLPKTKIPRPTPRGTTKSKNSPISPLRPSQVKKRVKAKRTRTVRRRGTRSPIMKSSINNYDTSKTTSDPTKTSPQITLSVNSIPSKTFGSGSGVFGKGIVTANVSNKPKPPTSIKRRGKRRPARHPPSPRSAPTD